jgi:hypothetical protein
MTVKNLGLSINMKFLAMVKNVNGTRKTNILLNFILF